MSNPYDVVPYPTGAEARLHIEHLQVCATLNGFSPAAVDTARVMEIGCGNGFNLGPMAAQFPNASFVGLDYAASAIEKGRAAMEELGLHNIDLRCADLREQARDGAVEELGQFDYVIAHGVYSWVGEDVREALWRLVGRVLAPKGVFHLSYSALPGWYAVRAVRDFAGFLSQDRARPFDALDASWDALGVIANHAESNHPFAMEAARIRRRPKSALRHDELSEACEPFYLTDVVRRAEREGFRYAGEAGSQVPSDLRRHADVAQKVLELSGDDLLLRLQLLDFTAMRRFHDTLFVRQAHTPSKRHIANTLLDCWARSDIHFVEENAAGARVYEHSGGVQLTSAHPMLCALADALEAAAPGSVSLGEFLASRQKPGAEPDAQLTLQFGQLILKLLESAAIQLIPREAKVARTVGRHPRTSAFARMQMAIDGRAPNAYHASMEIKEPWQRALLTLLDGSRDRDQLAEALATLSWREISGAEKTLTRFGIAESDAFLKKPERAASPEALLAFYREEVPQALEELMRKAYLV